MNEMVKYLEDFPAQCEKAVQIAMKSAIDVKRYDAIHQVVVSGMGGSAAVSYTHLTLPTNREV